MINIKECILGPDTPLLDAVDRLHKSRLNIILIIDNTNLLGVITDGDIRKAVLKGAANDENITHYMNKSPVILHSLDLKNAFKVSYETDLGSIPVIQNNKLTALFVRHLKTFITYEYLPIPQENLDGSIIALIMAGGEGKRLRPYTDKIPKSLAKIGNTTLIERNLASLADAGLKKVYVAVNYLSEKIEEKLGDGTEYNLEISYIKEEEKLGTAGPINYLNKKEFSHLIVLNADIVCNLLYSKLSYFHVNNTNDVTVVCSKNYMPISYGVISADDKLQITEIEEKPIKEFWCAAGIYMFKKNKLKEFFSKKITYLDMPDLINQLLDKKADIKAFPLVPEQEQWFDVADLNDLKEINKQEWAKKKN